MITKLIRSIIGGLIIFALCWCCLMLVALISGVPLAIFIVIKVLFVLIFIGFLAREWGIWTGELK